jgi:hypothetical protein
VGSFIAWLYIIDSSAHTIAVVAIPLALGREVFD